MDGNPTERRVSPELLQRLLAADSAEEAAELLRREHGLSRADLDLLLDEVDHVVASEPEKARKLAGVCREVAELEGEPGSAARALYVEGRAYDRAGYLDKALEVMSAARDRYVGMGNAAGALRARTGIMAMLLEPGRYAEALELGREILETIVRQRDERETRSALSPYDATLISSLVHQNRGVCLEYTGRYDEALESYSVAEEGFRSLGMKDRVGELTSNRGGISYRLGHTREALAADELAAQIFEEEKLDASLALALTGVGETRVELGDYAGGLEALRRARQLSSSLGTKLIEASAALDMADAYMALNLYDEALSQYRDAEALLPGGAAHQRALARWGTGAALAARGELEEAEEKLSGAAELFSAAGNAPLLSGVALERASLAEARGEHGEARSLARRALDLAGAGRSPAQEAYARLRLADLSADDSVECERHLEAARPLVEELSAPQLRYRLDQRLGRLRLLQGNLPEARALLERAVSDIERSRATVPQEAMRASFLDDKAAAYEDLVRVHLGDPNESRSVREAFSAAERAKSRTLAELMEGLDWSETSEPGDTSEGGGSGRKIWDLRGDLNAIYNRLLQGGDGSGEDTELLRRRAADLESEVSRLLLEETAASASGDPLAEPHDLETLPESLSAGAVLVEYFALGDEIVAFVVRDGRVRCGRGVGSVRRVEELLGRLSADWDLFRAGDGFAARHAERLELSARRVLGLLYDELLRPLEHELPAVSGDETSGLASRLVFVPHGPLHRVPFHALHDGERYLIEHAEVSYAPSARTYALCEERAALPAEDGLVLAVPDPRIPAAAREGRAVAGRIPGAELLEGEKATSAALRPGLGGRGVLHVACHGMFRRESPMFSALKLGDGWMLARDAAGLDLRGALVTLSACESGGGRVRGGDEVLGLARSFLAAGASSLVVSLWVVEDEPAAPLMDVFYRRLTDGAGRAQALRSAQLEAKEENPHPYYWAPFVLIGKRE